jgi:hypothetical protein
MLRQSNLAPATKLFFLFRNFPIACNHPNLYSIPQIEPPRDNSRTVGNPESSDAIRALRVASGLRVLQLHVDYLR